MSPKHSAPAHAPRFFKALGHRVRELRQKAGYSQGDMTRFKFSLRHWQQIEHGRPISLTTVLRICDVFDIKLVDLLHGLDHPAAPAPGESEQAG